MKLAVGTDLTLFQAPSNPNLNPDNSNNDKRRIITLNTMDTTQPFELSTCLDLYLDNVMANVPELALALHSRGFVRGLRLCQTQEIPYLSSTTLIDSLMDGTLAAPVFKDSQMYPNGTSTCLPPLFDPKVIDMDATAIMRFLKTSCCKEDGTYILTKSSTGQALQLFDLGLASEKKQKRFKWMLASKCSVV